MGVFLTVSIVLLLISSNEKENTSQLSTSSLESTVDKVTSQNKESENNDKVSKVLKPIDKIPKDVIAELNQQQFSKSPNLELLIITKQLRNCNLYTFIDSSNNLPSVKREQLILDYQVYCKNNISHYSAINEANKARDAQLIVMNLAMESEFSNLLQKGITFEFFDDEQKIKYFEDTIKTYINSHNGFIIAMLPDMAKSTDIKIYVNELSNVLGTINQKYTMDIADQALTLLSCQYSQGLSCTSTSHYMIKQCLADDKACGLDVQTWFKSNHTVAHNRDIDILVDLFSNY
jgi:hypothetical protein